MELAVFNREFLIANFSGLVTHELQFEDAQLVGFEYSEKQLTSTEFDPRVVFSNMNIKIRGIDVNCEPVGAKNNSAVFFRTIDSPFSEDNSLRFSLTEQDNLIFLPTTTEITGIRFDLAEDAGEELICDNIVLNPVLDFQPDPLRFVIYSVLIVFVTIVTFKYSFAQISEWLDRYYVWLIILMSVGIVLIDMSYDLVFTYDSGHYLWLSEIIRNNNFAKWDIIRNLAFPLHLFLSQTILSDSIIGLKIPMIIFHLGLFYALWLLVIRAGKIEKGSRKLIVAAVIILFIMLDPTVVGYYHAVLTEYYAATLAALACFISLMLYEAKWFSKKFWISVVLLSLISILGWHIKQPYLGIGLFPFFIAYFFKLLSKSTLKAWGIGFLVGIGLIVIVLSSSFAWEAFLTRQGNSLDTSRNFFTWVQTRLVEQEEGSNGVSGNLIKKITKKYLAASNFLYYHPGEKTVEIKPSLTRAAQNRMLAQNIYQVGRSNIVSLRYPSYPIEKFEKRNSPPTALNKLMLLRISQSNFIFILSYLSLPLLLIIFFIWWIRTKTPLAVSALILSGSAGLNALAHSFLAAPLDRYFFWGYPLILISWVCGIIALINHCKKCKTKTITIEVEEQH